MFFISALSWWYKDGWKQRGAMAAERLASTWDYFSLSLLLRTLFSPFRQISAGRVDGPLGVKMRAFFDNVLSRLIGAMVRIATAVVGVLVVAGYVLWSGLVLVGWGLVPLLPVAGLIMMTIGWVPAWSL